MKKEKAFKILEDLANLQNQYNEAIVAAEIDFAERLASIAVHSRYENDCEIKMYHSEVDPTTKVCLRDTEFDKIVEATGLELSDEETIEYNGITFEKW